MNLWAKLRRRSVFRVTEGYAVVAWLLLQVGDVASESLGFPDWFMPMLFVLLGLGFPVALVQPSSAYGLGVPRDVAVALDHADAVTRTYFADPGSNEAGGNSPRFWMWTPKLKQFR